MTTPYDVERQRALEQEALLGSQGAYLSAAVSQYASAYGAEDPSRAWVLSPFDTWEPNPHYSGPRVPHPDEQV